MLLLKWYGESVNDGAKDLKQFTNTIVTLGLVHESVEYIRYGPANEGPVRHKLTIDAMQYRL